ncbi:uncharacterized protein M6G45_002771 [Spheniscus humboldti]
MLIGEQLSVLLSLGLTTRLSSQAPQMALTDSYSIFLSSVSFFPDGLMFDKEVLERIFFYFWRTVSLLREEPAFWGFSNHIILQSQEEWLSLGLSTSVSASVPMDFHYMEELWEVMKETEVLENMERENKRVGWADQTPAKKISKAANQRWIKNCQ